MSALLISTNTLVQRKQQRNPLLEITRGPIYASLGPHANAQGNTRRMARDRGIVTQRSLGVGPRWFAVRETASTAPARTHRAAVRVGDSHYGDESVCAAFVTSLGHLDLFT